MEDKEYELPEEEGTDATAADGVPAEAPLSWQFGERTAPPTAVKPKSGRFYGAFAAVVAATLALLVLLLFVGEAGIKIYRTVTNERTIFVREDGTDGELLTPAEAAEVVRASTVTIFVRRADALGIGSGFIYTADGYICTNYHVVEDTTEVQVILPSGEAVDATVVGSNADADIAVLKIEKTGLTPVKTGTSATLLVGEDVVVVGTPHSIEYSGTATFGKISYTNRLLSIKNSDNTVAKKMTMIQTDAAVNNGNSGGPLANMYGEVIGIVAMKQFYTLNGNPIENIGFAIPIDGAKIIIDAIIANGSFTGENPVVSPRSVLGVTGRGLKGGYWYSDPMSDQLTESATEVEGYFLMPRDGVYVVSVSGLDAMGKIRVGDIMIKVNGLRVYTIYNVIDAVNRHRAGETVTVTVLRQNGADYTEHTVEVLVTEG